MALHDVAKTLHLLHAVEVTGGVVGVADEDSFGLGGYRLLELVGLGKGEAVLDPRNDALYRQSRHLGEAKVIGVTGVDHDDFITGIEARKHGEKEGFRTSGSHKNLIGVDVDSDPCVVFAELHLEALQSLGRAVLQGFAVYLLEGVKGLLRCGKIGLADIEMVHFHAFGLGRIGVRDQFAYGRSGHRFTPSGNFRHIEKRLLQN